MIDNYIIQNEMKQYCGCIRIYYTSGYRKTQSCIGKIYYYDTNLSYHHLTHEAVTHSDGTTFWYKFGKRHRIGGAASTFIKTGIVTEKCWWKENKRHRLNAPAIITISNKEYWEFGLNIS